MKLIKNDKIRKSNKRIVTSIRISPDLLTYVKENNINLSATVEEMFSKILKQKSNGN